MGDYIPTDLRRLVYERAHGCCEYCLIPETAVLAVHEIDHIISQKHNGKSTPQNLALSCSLCNKLKGSDIASIDPDTEDIIALYHPRRDKWTEHFKLSDGKIISLTPTGNVMVRLLHFNSMNRIEERSLLMKAWFPKTHMPKK